ncbi:tetratricopeptide repeat protein [Pinibacter soli]|uniref:Tetratricopeptide repeat protein n=1 Tax=Pinibacter soli TaxID=3044211 RepID=A0ABT6RHY5_9BACT|nr:tetratricopeptide repeat protein [Pinibacter soli]MDI3321990.1 tetratricopeptide repeat protein [Pinibacter soli]
MGLFDFLKSNGGKPSIDLTDYKFLSDDHTRIEDGRPLNANNKGAWRGIRIITSDNSTFYVMMYNMNENHPVWGDNIQMAKKKMKIIEESTDKIVLRGFGTDATGASFADYGITLHKSNNDIAKITLHMHDRRVDIVYEKANDKKQSETLNQYSDFDSFKAFTYKWNTSMPMNEKMMIAAQSDKLNNQGVNAYNNDDIANAIRFYEQALTIMPNNDDALKNLKICYSQIGRPDKAAEMEKKLNYLS